MYFGKMENVTENVNIMRIE